MSCENARFDVNRLLTVFIYGLTTALGVIAFLYPFWLPSLAQGNGMGLAHSSDAPLMMTLLVGLCFAVLLLEVQSNGMSAKVLALLGVLVAMNSVLRFAEVAIPGPGGFSPIFLLIILGGYVYGARFGFLLGTLTIFVSGLFTGAIGPWMPYQMFVAGWTGMAAPLCRPIVRSIRVEGRLGEIIILAVYGAVCGLIYGVVMNLWFWPFMVGGADYYWSPDMTVGAIVRSYAFFYTLTSLVWDLLRAAGNFTLILLFGTAVLKVLNRFRSRFTFIYHVAENSASEPAIQTVEANRRAQPVVVQT